MTRTTSALAAALAAALASQGVDANCYDADRLLERSEGLADASARIRIVQQAIMECPEHAQAHYRLGTLLQEAGDRQAALAAYHHSVAADPELATPHAAIGDLYFEQTDYRAAIAAYEQFLSLAEAASRLGNDSIAGASIAYYETRLANARAQAEETGLLSAAQIRGQLETVLSSEELAASLSERRERNSQPGSGWLDLHILFGFDSAEVQPQSMRQLELVAEALRGDSLADRRIRIEGHTDARGTAAYNQRLSLRRAVAVRDLLVTRYGLSPERLEAVGMGESLPIASNDGAEGRAANRRVTFVNLGTYASPSRP